MTATWADIAAGVYDQVILARATDLIAFDGPVIFSFQHEPENDHAAGTPAAFIAAFRHVRSVFENAGVTNVTYAWTMMAWGGREDPAAPGRKATWIDEASTQIKKWPDIVGVVYYDADKGCARWVDSSTSSLASFRAMGADPYFDSAAVDLDHLGTRRRHDVSHRDGPVLGGRRRRLSVCARRRRGDRRATGRAGRTPGCPAGSACVRGLGGGWHRRSDDRPYPLGMDDRRPPRRST